MYGFCAFAFQVCEESLYDQEKTDAQKTEFNADFVDAGLKNVSKTSYR
jgi:hypothetical protein